MRAEVRGYTAVTRAGGQPSELWPAPRAQAQAVSVGRQALSLKRLLTGWSLVRIRPGEPLYGHFSGQAQNTSDYRQTTARFATQAAPRTSLFHGGNTGSIPVGRASEIKDLATHLKRLKLPNQNWTRNGRRSEVAGECAFERNH
jgi:hypothetical protein